MQEGEKKTYKRGWGFGGQGGEVEYPIAIMEKDIN